MIKLVGRRPECGMPDRLVEAVCAGQSRALVLCREPDVAKTALLQHPIDRAASCRVVRILGVQSEIRQSSWSRQNRNLHTRTSRSAVRGVAPPNLKAAAGCGSVQSRTPYLTTIYGVPHG